LDVSAAINNDEIIVAVVNRNKDKAITTDILLQEGNFDGKLSVYEVNGPDIKAENNFGSEKIVTKENSAINAKGQKVTYSFPAHSFTLMKGKIK
jgi:alpha-N-arabinofuranosidase